MFSASFRQGGYWSDRKVKIGGRDEVHRGALNFTRQNDNYPMRSSRSTLRELTLSRAAGPSQNYAAWREVERTSAEET
jgi:hypothetical protein